MFICYVALNVMLQGIGGSPVYGKSLIRKESITSMVAMEVVRSTGTRIETRITVQGGGAPLYTLFAPHEVARLPCQDLRP